jgi:hypothetical protein
MVISPVVLLLVLARQNPGFGLGELLLSERTTLEKVAELS